MKNDHFFNRELSWLSFNERVLEEAAKETLPVLERIKFLAITAANLDEFYMVRVGGLQFLKDANKRVRDLAGLTPTQQLSQIRERTLHFIDRQYSILNRQIRPLLNEKGIRRLVPDELTPGQRTHLHEYFNEQIFPVLSPIAVEPEEERIALPALQLLLLSEVRSRPKNTEVETIRYVVFTIPPSLPRQVTVSEVEGATYAYINLEDIVEMFIHQYFPQEQVHGTARFRLSRNSDITLDDESAQDLAAEMEQILVARKTSGTIRLEIEEQADVTPALIKVVQRLCDTQPSHTYIIPGELDLRSCFALASIAGFESLKVTPWPTAEVQETEASESIFDLVKEGDILLHHPYESFEPVMQLVEQAAKDPHVIAIKQILYRTAKNSRIISALLKAAQAGKHVTVLVELKARFDEARNLERAEELLNAGAQIIYGVRGLKTHAKICLVLRRESGRMMRYCHFGTGNYNEATAKIYTDISYLTRRPEYGSDATSFFHTVTGRSRFVHFQRISMAPFGLRERLVEMIQSETERANQGESAAIMLKMNSLEDSRMIEALYAASKAGVKIRLCVRGICCLRPGVKGLSENIRVISIIDRYLEHARIFWFRQGGNPVVFISSADFMNRNLSKRVELLTPVEDSEAKKRLEELLETQFSDNVQARELDKDGIYHLVPPAAKGKALRSQEYFSKQAARRHRPRVQSSDVLIPHVPK